MAAMHAGCFCGQAKLCLASTHQASTGRCASWHLQTYASQSARKCVQMCLVSIMYQPWERNTCGPTMNSDHRVDPQAET